MPEIVQGISLGIVANKGIISPVESTVRLFGLSEHVVLIGACGWQHKDWLGEFYPEDLPDEWKLGYYGNEFQVVMVPASYWAMGPGAFDEWLEESDESLKMVCEWPVQDSTPALLAEASEGIKKLSSRVLAVLVPLDRVVSQEQIEVYKELGSSYKLCFDVKKEHRANILPCLAEYLAGYDYSLCWRGESDVQQDLELGTVSVSRITGDIEPKKLREIVETILSASNPERHMVIIVDGEPPSMQLLTNVGIILDLL